MSKFRDFIEQLIIIALFRHLSRLQHGFTRELVLVRYSFFGYDITAVFAIGYKGITHGSGINIKDLHTGYFSSLIY